MIVSFVNIDEWEKLKRHCNDTIAETSLESDVKRHWKVMLFLLSLAFLYFYLGKIQIVWCLFCEFFICAESIALGNCANLASSIGSQTSGNISMCTTKATPTIVLLLSCGHYEKVRIAIAAFSLS